jgi:predicted acetyltransferase
MKRNLRRFGGFVLAALLLPGVATLLSSSTVEAQRRGRVIIVRRPIYRPFYRPWGWGWGYNDRFDYYSRYAHYIFDNPEKAASEGFKDGLKTGRGDAKNRRTYDPHRSHYYQEAGFGNFGEVYRAGFLRGYADGFRS